MRAIVSLFGMLLAALLLSGCAAMMMGGDTGGYQPPADECSESDRRAGRCTG